MAQPTLPELQRFLTDHHDAIGLPSASEYAFEVSGAYFSASLGMTHVYLEQQYEDIRVFNGILNLNFRDDSLISFGNRWIPHIQRAAPSLLPAITPEIAVTRAVQQLELSINTPVLLESTRNKQNQIVKAIFHHQELFLSNITAELFWLSQPEKSVSLCWAVITEMQDGQDIWMIFVDAHSGEILRKENLVLRCEFDTHHESDCAARHFHPMEENLASALMSPDSSYHVFALPIESPNHGNRSVVTTPWNIAGAGNPAVTLGWHDTGSTEYTITRGNNVHAYEDTDGSNTNNPGYSPDTNNLRFDYPFDPLLHPEDNMDAAITNLFYWNNIIHDVMYQYGFDEPSGNFQVNNLGRGGSGNDAVRAEALDGGGTNNANFSTPADGSQPRMQMYLWSSISEDDILNINTPISIAGSMFAIESGFSINNKLEDVGIVTGDLVLVDDLNAPTHLACGELENEESLAGKIAVIDRGDCNFTIKVKKAQDLGAIAAIMINNVAGNPIAMGGSDNTIVIPAVMVSLADGNQLKNVLDTSNINVTLDAVNSIIPDGDYDNAIIIHEYGHGISNRLTGGPNQVNCLNNDEQMGEGWSDYFGLMLTTDWPNAEAEDRRGIGTYVIGQPTDGTGIRTYPYTTDLEINPFTYADVEDAPVGGGSVSPHFVGSIWCTMLWDMTWNIIEMNPPDTDLYHGTGGNNVALQLVMDGLKLQPCNPGFVDGRDAILLADEIRYGGLYKCAIWEAFANRGLGVQADQGSSDNHTDGVPSFDIPTGVRVRTTPSYEAVQEGQPVTFTIQAVCDCSDLTDVEVREEISEELIYIPGSGGELIGDDVVFDIGAMAAQDTMEVSYSGYIAPCSATLPETLLVEDAEAPDAFQTIQLGGSGTKVWLKNAAQQVSPSNSWYAQDYTTLSNFALTQTTSVMTEEGPVDITFYHRYSTEANYDGGVVEYTLNNGATWLDAGPYFLENGYPDFIFTAGTDSPIAGRDAFTGNSDVEFDTSGFIQSRIRLFPGEGQTLRIRFRFVCDSGVGGSGLNGWYVDDIVVQQRYGVIHTTFAFVDSEVIDSTASGVETNMVSGHRLYVDSGATGSRDGSTWEDAMAYLPLAVELAGCREVDTILLAEGIYLPSLSDDRTVSFSFPDSMVVIGGFPEGGSAFEDRDPAQYNSILSGDIGTAGNASDNAYHVIAIDSLRKGIFLDGVHIHDGNANGSGENNKGAGIYCRGEFALFNSILMNHQGTGNGQIISVHGNNAHLHLRDCHIFFPPGNLTRLNNSGGGIVTISGNTTWVLDNGD